MYICMYVSICVCVCVYLYVCMCECMSEFINVCVQVFFNLWSIYQVTDVERTMYSEGCGISFP